MRWLPGFGGIILPWFNCTVRRLDPATFRAVLRTLTEVERMLAAALCILVGDLEAAPGDARCEQNPALPCAFRTR
jgi:hypothetical protein